jgi:hypothetical protein
MKYIQLYEYTNSLEPIVGTYATVDDDNYIFLDQWTWKLNPHNGEALRNCRGLPVYMQDAVWERAGRTGTPRHISDPLDNQRASLTLGIPALKPSYRRTVTWDKDKEMWRLETSTTVDFFSDPKDGKTNLEQAMDVFQKSEETDPAMASGVPGVEWDKDRKKWRATIAVDVDLVPIHLGYFTDVDAAIRMKTATTQWIVDVLTTSPTKPAPTPEHFKEITWNDREQMFCATVSFGVNNPCLIFFDDLYGLLAEAHRVQEIYDAEGELPEPEFTPTVTPCKLEYNTKIDKWMSKIEVNGIPIIVGISDHFNDARAAVEQYFTKEKP